MSNTFTTSTVIMHAVNVYPIDYVYKIVYIWRMIIFQSYTWYKKYLEVKLSCAEGLHVYRNNINF